MANLAKESEKIENKLMKLVKYLTSRYEFRRNSIKNRIEYTLLGVVAWEQVNELKVWNEVNTYFSKPHYGLDYICNALGSPQVSPAYNPLEAWLEGLSLDGHGLPFPLSAYNPVEQLCAFVRLKSKGSLEADQVNKIRFCQALQLWFIRSVRCVYEPLFAAKQCFVLMGPQSIGKTPFLKSFLPPDKQEFIKMNPSLHPLSKDGRIALSTNLIVIFDEIDDHFKCRENRDNHKSYMTTTTVNERLPYGKVETARERVCSFLGTCNESHFLNDPTGTDRWVVFEVEGFENRGYNGGVRCCVEDFPVEQCWAWAYSEYKEGATGEYTTEWLEQNERENEAFKYNSDEFEILQEYLAPAGKSMQRAEFMTTTQVCMYLNSQQEHVNFQRYLQEKHLDA